jgi:hypothetical protein
VHVNAGLDGTLISAVTEDAAYISDNFGASCTRIQDTTKNYYAHFCGVTKLGYSNSMPLFFTILFGGSGMAF